MQERAGASEPRRVQRDRRSAADPIGRASHVVPRSRCSRRGRRVSASRSLASGRPGAFPPRPARGRPFQPPRSPRSGRYSKTFRRGPRESISDESLSLKCYSVAENCLKRRRKLKL